MIVAFNDLVSSIPLRKKRNARIMVGMPTASLRKNPRLVLLIRLELKPRKRAAKRPALLPHKSRAK